MPEKRRAGAMNVYEISQAKLSGVLRYLFNGEHFALETGGPYGTGR
jgi:hypothetical protein